MKKSELKKVIEAALLAADAPLSVNQIRKLFADQEIPKNAEVKKAIESLIDDCKDRGVELREVASGFRYQVRQEQAPLVAKLWDEKPPRYTKALLETLALIAYRQPVTRGEIEGVRGVSVSSNIIHSLIERNWIKVIGHKEVPGRPALFATTNEFLDYFNLKSLQELPTLEEITDLEAINPELKLVSSLEVVASEKDDPAAVGESDAEGESVEEVIDIQSVQVTELAEDTSNVTKH